MEKYYIYLNGEYFIKDSSDGYFDLDDAIKVARENDCDEVEMHIWNNEEDYNNYLPADDFKVVWRKGC